MATASQHAVVLWNIHGDAASVLPALKTMVELGTSVFALNEVNEGTLELAVVPALEEASSAGQKWRAIFAPCKPQSTFGNALLFATDRFSLIDHEIVYLPHGRSVMRARLNPAHAAALFDVYVTHLDSRSEATRVEQITALLDYERRTAVARRTDFSLTHKPVGTDIWWGSLLLGDMNAVGRAQFPSPDDFELARTAHHAAHRRAGSFSSGEVIELIHSAGWVDTFILGGSACSAGFTAPVVENGAKPCVRIDYCFASCDWMPRCETAMTLDDIFLSDHFPIFFRFEEEGGHIICQNAADTSIDGQKCVLLCDRMFDCKNSNVNTATNDCAIVLCHQRITAVYREHHAVLIAQRLRAGVWPGVTLLDLGSNPDASSSTCALPGFIDCHVHPFIAIAGRYQEDHLRNSSAYKCLRGLQKVQALLRFGWTCLRVAGDADSQHGVADLRRCIDEGLHVGPRIVGANHYLSCTGGGGDIHWLSNEAFCAGKHSDGRIVDGADAVRRAIREEVRFGSDWIKILLTGAYMTTGRNDTDRVTFSSEELRAVMEEAKAWGVPVMAHAHGARAIELAIRSGVRSVEHSTFIDAAGIEALRERVDAGDPAWLVPTLLVGVYGEELEGLNVSSLHPPTDQPAAQLEKMVRLHRANRDRQMSCLNAAIQSGVPIALGTDYVGWPPELSVREFSLLVEAGMSVGRSLCCGTSHAAQLLGLADQIGALEEGKMADIVVVNGDPFATGINGARHLDDVLRDIVVVLHNGSSVQ